MKSPSEIAIHIADLFLPLPHGCVMKEGMTLAEHIAAAIEAERARLTPPAEERKQTTPEFWGREVLGEL